MSHLTSFKLGSGERLVFLGSSGSGKSQLLDSLLSESRARTELVAGTDAVSLPVRKTARQLWEKALGKLDAELRRARIQEVTEALELSTLVDRKIATLSLGERNRVALGRAWVLEPELLILDEPFAAIAGPLRSRLRRKLVGWLERTQRAAVIATQEANEALSWAASPESPIAVLSRNSIAQQGSARELYLNPANRAVAEVFGLCFLEGRLDTRDGMKLFAYADGETEGTLPLTFLKGMPEVPGAEPGRGSIALGVRPESLRVARTPEELATDPVLEAALPGPQALPGWEAPWMATREEALWLGSAGARLRLVGVVLRSEWLGFETRLEIQLGSSVWNIKARATDLKVGERCWVELPREELLWFDAQGTRLHAPELGDLAEPASMLALEDEPGTRGLKTRPEAPARSPGERKEAGE